MANRHKVRLAELERLHLARQTHREGAKERLYARLDAIGQRLRAHDVVIEMDADEVAQRVAMVKTEIQREKESYRGAGY